MSSANLMEIRASAIECARDAVDCMTINDVDLTKIEDEILSSVRPPASIENQLGHLRLWREMLIREIQIRLLPPFKG